MSKFLTTDEEILEYFEWVVVCESPYEIYHDDGSVATGQAVHHVIVGLREEYINEMYEKFQEDYIKLNAKAQVLNNLKNK